MNAKHWKIRLATLGGSMVGAVAVAHDGLGHAPGPVASAVHQWLHSAWSWPASALAVGLVAALAWDLAARRSSIDGDD